MSGSYKSLLGLNELAVDALDIKNLDLTNTNIVGLNTDRIPEDADPVNLYFTNARFDDRLSNKTTSDLTEGSRYYYTDERVSQNDDVVASNQHRISEENPHHTTLFNLTDTTITDPTDGQFITYNNTDNKWKNTSLG